MTANRPPLVPNKGHIGQIANSNGGFVSGVGSCSSSIGLANVPIPAFGFNLSGKYYTLITYDFPSSTAIVVASYLETEKFGITSLAFSFICN